EVFASSFSLFNIGKGSEIFIIDDNNNIIISENNLNSNFILEETNLNKFLKDKGAKDTAMSISVNGENYVATYRKLKGFNWYIASMIPYDFINADIQSLKKEMTIIGLLFTLVVLIFSYFLYSSIKVP
ncbi:sensor histidine kinase, partial [Clostridium perfringens]|nr:sensor histidine kinase [Clostridium perfringens]